MMNSHGQARGAALVAAAALLWSSSGLAIKSLALGPLQIAGARSLVAALTIAAAVRFRGGHPFPRPRPLDWACAGSYAAMLTLFVASTKLTTAANAIFLQFSAPVYLVFLEPWATRRRLQGRDLAAVALCMTAMACFFGGRLEGGTLAGNSLGVLSGIMLALFTLTLKLGRDRHAGGDPITAIILGNLLVAAACAPWALPGFRPTWGQGAALLYLGVFQIGAAYLLFNAGMRHLSATAAVVTGTLEAVLNPVWVFVGLGERPSPMALAGGALMLATIGWYTLTPRPARPAAP